MILFMFFNFKLVFFLVFIFSLSLSPFISSMALLLLCFSFLLILSSFGNWLSFILSLIYLGGVLVLFIYISSLLPNKKNYSFSVLGITIYILIFFLFSFQNFFWESDFFFQKVFYSFTYFKYFMFFLCFLSVVLVMVSGICKKILYPLRLV